MRVSIAGVIAFVVLGTYFVGWFALRERVAQLRDVTKAKHVLPHPAAFLGPAAWAYAFSGRHREVGDPKLSFLVRVWRWAILLMPIGIWAFFTWGSEAG